MDTYKPTARFNVPSESQTLCIRIKDIIIGTGENKKAILFQVILSHH